jgi:hypothetical protein
MEKIKVVIDGKEHEAPYRTFASGKKGYGVYGTQVIDGKNCRISLNIIEVG